MQAGQPQQPPIQLVAWIIWFAILSGMVILQFFVGGGIPSGTNNGHPPALQQFLPAAPAFLALVIRFLVLPRIPTAEKKLPIMIVGLAFAEATGLLGMFIVSKEYGSTQLTFFILSILAILSLAPIYLKNNPDKDTYLR